MSLKLKTKEDFVEELFEKYIDLLEYRESLTEVCECLEHAFGAQNKVYTAGNGQVAMVMEEMAIRIMRCSEYKRKLSDENAQLLMDAHERYGFLLGEALREYYPVYSLNGERFCVNSFMNERDLPFVYAQQLYTFARADDVFICMAEEEMDRSLLYAVTVAKARGMKVIGIAQHFAVEQEDLFDIRVYISDLNKTSVFDYGNHICAILCGILGYN